MRQGRQRHAMWLAAPLVLALVLFPSLSFPANGAGSAEGYVKELAQQAIALARPGADDQAAKLEQLLDRSTDVATVAKLVLGRNWRAASPGQREEYLKLFRGYVLTGISRRFGAAKGIVEVDVTGEKSATHDDSMVATKVTLGNGAPPSQVEWRVRRTVDGYRIVDVVAEGVSLVQTKRSEFSAIVANSGMDGLLRQLREWRDHPEGRRPEA